MKHGKYGSASLICKEYVRNNDCIYTYVHTHTRVCVFLCVCIFLTMCGFEWVSEDDDICGS